MLDRRVMVPDNLFFLFNVGPGFFLCSVGEICAMLAWSKIKINWSKIKIA